MKKLLVLSTALLGLISCGSDDEIATQDFQNDVVGTWYPHKIESQDMTEMYEHTSCGKDLYVFKSDFSGLETFYWDDCSKDEEKFFYTIIDNKITFFGNECTIVELSNSKMVLDYKADLDEDGILNDTRITLIK